MNTKYFKDINNNDECSCVGYAPEQFVSLLCSGMETTETMNKFNILTNVSRYTRRTFTLPPTNVALNKNFDQ